MSEIDQWEDAREYLEEGRLDEAELAYEALVAAHSGPCLATAKGNLARVLGLKGRYAEARPLFDAAVEILQAQYGEDDEEVSLALTHYAQMLQHAGELSEAASMQSRSLSMYRKAVREGHEFMVAVLLRRLGSIREDEDLPLDALEAYREALEIDQRFYGSSDVTVDDDIRLIANVLTKSGTGINIENYLQELVAKQSSERGGGSDLANTLASLGRALAASGNFPEAEKVLKRAIALKRDDLGAESVEAQFDIHELAKLLIQTARSAEADPLLRQALRITEGAFGSRDARVVNIKGTLATALLAQGLHDEAITRIEQIAEASAEVWGPESEGTVKILAFLDKVKTLRDRM